MATQPKGKELYIFDAEGICCGTGRWCVVDTTGEKKSPRWPGEYGDVTVAKFETLREARAALAENGYVHTARVLSGVACYYDQSAEERKAARDTALAAHFERMGAK